MMVAQYSCSVDVEVPKNKKIMQWAGIFAILFSLGFVMLSVFYSWYFMIAFAFFFAGGVVNLHFYNDVKGVFVRIVRNSAYNRWKGRRKSSKTPCKYIAKRRDGVWNYDRHERQA